MRLTPIEPEDLTVDPYPYGMVVDSLKSAHACERPFERVGHFNSDVFTYWALECQRSPGCQEKDH
jgi:hypothetical protein